MSSQSAAAKVKKEKPNPVVRKVDDAKNLGAYYGSPDTRGTYLSGMSQPTLNRVRFLGG